MFREITDAICAIMSNAEFHDLEPRSVWTAMRKGWRRRCPSCGEGRVFHGYTKVNDECPACGLELHHHRSDDLPPYLSIMIVGHIIVPLLLIVEQTWQPNLWLHMAIWIPLVLLLSLYLLPRLKGAVIGLQWANRMHGFGLEEEDEPVSP